MTVEPEKGGARAGPRAADECAVEGCGHARYVHGTKLQSADERTGACLVRGCSCLAFRPAHADEAKDNDREHFCTCGPGGPVERHDIDCPHRLHHPDDVISKPARQPLTPAYFRMAAKAIEAKADEGWYRNEALARQVAQAFRRLLNEDETDDPT